MLLLEDFIIHTKLVTVDLLQIPLGEIVERNIRIVIIFAGNKPAHQLACSLLSTSHTTTYLHREDTGGFPWR